MTKETTEPVSYATLNLKKDLSAQPALIVFETMDEWRAFHARYRQTLSLKSEPWMFDDRLMMFQKLHDA